MKITHTSVMVDDQDKALRFYTEVLGFIPKLDIPAGEYRWLTVVSPAAPDGTELVLEPMGFEPARDFQKALLEAGIPWTAFGVDDIQSAYEKLSSQGVKFRVEPTVMDWGGFAIFEDTCGNLIQIQQVNA